MTATSRIVTLPDLGEGLAEAEVVEWLVAVGDLVAVDQAIVEVETAKATVTVPSPRTGVVAALHAEPGDVVPVGARLLSFEADDGEPAGTTASLEEPLVGLGPTAHPAGGRSRRRRPHATVPRSAADPRPGGPDRIRSGRAAASPAVRWLAQSLGIDLSTVQGSGPEGLILREDVERAAAQARSGQQLSQPSASPAVAKLVRSHQEIPDVTVWLDVDASGLLHARDQLAEEMPEAGHLLLGLIASLCVAGLRRYPALNGRYDVETQTAVENDVVNLGVAVQTDRGLVVPVVQDANALTVRDICAAVSDIVTRAREGRLEASHLLGGTFTLNNYGGLGVDGATAIINYPEAAILGVGRIMPRPWAVDGQVVVRPVVTVSIVYDHRISDGAYASDFLRSVCGRFGSAADVLGD